MWRCYGGAGESYAVGLTPPHRCACCPTRAARCSPEQGVAPRAAAGVDPGALPALQAQRDLAAAVFEGMEEELVALRNRAEREGAMTRDAVLETMTETLDDIEQALALIKHEGFSDEREVRHTTVLLQPDDLSEWGGVVRYRPTRYGMAPYVWLTGAAPDDGAPPLFTDAVAPLPIRCVAISPSPNGPGRRCVGPDQRDRRLLRPVAVQAAGVDPDEVCWTPASPRTGKVWIARTRISSMPSSTDRYDGIPPGSVTPGKGIGDLRTSTRYP